MLGICNTTLVTEYYPSSLDQVIWVKRDRLSFRKVIYMALDAARGLQALHEASVAPIVHFDMKPRQLLIDDRGRLMLNDFNAAQFMDAHGSGLPCQFTMRACRAVVWRSPENQAGKVRNVDGNVLAWMLTAPDKVPAGQFYNRLPGRH